MGRAGVEEATASMAAALDSHRVKSNRSRGRWWCVVLLVSVSMPHAASNLSTTGLNNCAAVRAHVRSLPTIAALDDDDEVRGVLSACYDSRSADDDDSFECAIRRDTISKMFGDDSYLFERLFYASFPRCGGRRPRDSPQSIHASSSLAGICELRKERIESSPHRDGGRRTLPESDSVIASQHRPGRDRRRVATRRDDGMRETHASSKGRRLTACSIPSSGTYALAEDCSLTSTVTVSAASLTIRGVGLQPTIDGGNSRRLFNVQNSATLRIENVHLTNGSAYVSTHSDSYGMPVTHSTHPA